MPRGVYVRTLEYRKIISNAQMGKNNHNYGKDFAGEKSPSWRGGKRLNSGGYIWIYSPHHPFRNSVNCITEHRLIMEKHIGRYLKPREIVHHINGIKNDNRIENLKLFSTDREHSKYHFPKGSKIGKNKIKKER